MSEKNSADGPKISFSLNGNKYQMRPDNSEVHTYSQVPETDHFIIRRVERERRLATRVFRAAFPMFDEWAEFMEERGYPVTHAAYPEDKVFMAYREHHEEPVLRGLHDLTPREERKINFEGWRMQNGIVVPQSFADGTL